MFGYAELDRILRNLIVTNVSYARAVMRSAFHVRVTGSVWEYKLEKVEKSRIGEKVEGLLRKGYPDWKPGWFYHGTPKAGQTTPVSKLRPSIRRDTAEAWDV